MYDTFLIVCVKWYENLRLPVGDVSLLNGMWKHLQTKHGVADKEERKDYKRFNEPIYVPLG